MNSDYKDVENIESVGTKYDDEESSDGEIIESESNANSTEEPIIQIKFLNKNYFENVGDQIIKFLNNILNHGENDYKFIVKDNDTTKWIDVFNNILNDNKNTADVDNNISINEDLIIHEKPPNSPDFSKDLQALFTIDTTPVQKVKTNEVPSYKRTIKQVLDDETLESKQKKEEEIIFQCKRPRLNGACFNCGATDHSLRDCNLRRNNERINRARRSLTKNDRYHLDQEQRFSHLKPGIISEDLRKALDIRRGELPFFFYRMRVFGYPPGWLEDARIEQSGISLIDCENDIHDEFIHTGDMFDISRIHDFPGYNCSPGSKYYDDYMYHNVPPMSKEQSKEEFIKALGIDNVFSGYRRKKLKATSVRADNSGHNESVTDMDIEDDNENDSKKISDPSQSLEKSSSSDTESDISTSNSKVNGSVSPSLDELMKEQKKIMEALENNTAIVDKQESDNQINLTANTITEIQLNVHEQPNSISNTPNQTNDIIKDTHLGTPLLKFSPFDKLPSGENFKVGVSDVINFENLPDSCGKYEKMKVVIERVRHCITKLQKESDDNEHQ